MTPLKAQAIQTALTGDWETAINLNQNILQEEPEDRYVAGYGEHRSNRQVEFQSLHGAQHVSNDVG